eukprot:scaffold1362_cov163-Amphora_coffeaeformis.AAC.14
MTFCDIASTKLGMEFEPASNDILFCTPKRPMKKRGFAMLFPPIIVRANMDEASSVFRPTKSPCLFGPPGRTRFRCRRGSSMPLPRIPEIDDSGDDEDDDDEVIGINFPRHSGYLQTHLHRRSTRLPGSLESICHFRE